MHHCVCAVPTVQWFLMTVPRPNPNPGGARWTHTAALTCWRALTNAMQITQAQIHEMEAVFRLRRGASRVFPVSTEQVGHTAMFNEAMHQSLFRMHRFIQSSFMHSSILVHAYRHRTQVTDVPIGDGRQVLWGVLS